MAKKEPVFFEGTKGPFQYRMGGAFEKPGVQSNTEHGMLRIAECNTDTLRVAASITGETLPDGFGANADEANARLFAASKDLLYLCEYVLRNTSLEGTGTYRIAKEAYNNALGGWAFDKLIENLGKI